MMRLIKFLLGLSLGAAAGVLFAPKSGRELREQLRNGDLLSSAAGRLLTPAAERVPLPETSAVESAEVVSPQAEAPSVQPPPLEEAPAPETSSRLGYEPLAAETGSAAATGVPTPAEVTLDVLAEEKPAVVVITPLEAPSLEAAEQVAEEEVAEPAEEIQVVVEPAEDFSDTIIGVAETASAPAEALSPPEEMPAGEPVVSSEFAASVAEVEDTLEPSVWAPLEMPTQAPVETPDWTPAEPTGAETHVPAAVAPTEEAPVAEPEDWEAPVAAEAPVETQPVAETLIVEPAEEQPVWTQETDASPAQAATAPAVIEEPTRAAPTGAPIEPAPRVELPAEPSMWAPIEVSHEPRVPRWSEEREPQAEEVVQQAPEPTVVEEPVREPSTWSHPETPVAPIGSEPAEVLEEQPSVVADAAAEVAAPLPTESEEATTEFVTEPTADETPVEAVAAEVPDETPVEAVAEPEYETPPAPHPAEDLLARIEETRAALAADLAEPFGRETIEPIAPSATAAEEPPVVSAVPSAPFVDAPSTPQPTFTEPAAPAWPAATSSDGVPSLGEAEPTDRDLYPMAAASEVAVPEIEAPSAVESPFTTGETAATAPVSAPPTAPPPAPPLAPSASSDGVSIDQAEMRRRIEETRTRLKAKAFDAMMSGESALLRHGSGAKPLPSSPDTRIEPEIDSTIDKSLTQEDF